MGYRDIVYLRVSEVAVSMGKNDDQPWDFVQTNHDSLYSTSLG